jgi:hypothetical protein
MSVTERIRDITLSWNLLLPQITAPSEYWLGQICSYPDAAVERGLKRAAVKFGSSSADSEQVARYVRSVASNEFKDREWNIQDDDPASRW